ncbi:flagellin [Meridianimarinicoccus aquatilis]|uniref:Flagellin C-terminal domain-containing protein n=1 Tax=Meridianimarinicoccus aquatilis TaxID=2552766 RepID=A0A4R6B2V3_9RHOB|nr:flagellin [Fluviibacterium aquatile]TDL89226.1 hypothetical protein E2L05_07180 [Fluviibacterium aquatile]
MKLANLGDMAQATRLRRDTVDVKTNLNRLTQEMNSGLKADLSASLKGQFSPLVGLERGLVLNETYLASNRAAARFAEGQQTALDNLQSIVLSAGPEFLKIASTGEDTQLGVTFGNSKRQLDQVISALNGRVGPQSLFAGAATDGPALSSSEDILSGLKVALVGLTSPSDVEAAAKAWFDTPGGGFETIGYTGSTLPRSGMDIAEGQRETLAVTALDPAIRDTLRGFAVAALMDQGLLSGDSIAQRAVLQEMGETLVGATDQITALRADIGFVQERIETARVRSEAEVTGLRLARAALIEADPYQTAMQLTQVQAQLETIYTVTARVSGLSLASVLR